MIEHAKSINLCRQRLWLLPQKAVYWQKRKTLLVADLHVGKSGHFRRNGIPVPRQVNRNTLGMLDKIMGRLEPGHVVFLGDLFHSELNREWQQFRDWRKRYPETEVTLVTGNHDILPPERYHSAHISVFKRLRIDPFLLVHDIESVLPAPKQQSYLLGGHIHPAVQLKGRGRQNMKVPCYYFGSEAGILPAFGQFTGTALIHPRPDDRTFLIIDGRVVPTENVK